MLLNRLLLVGALVGSVGCTSVHVVQRDGCWVKRTEKTLGGSTEELGFCQKPAMAWAEDPLSRLAQECIAQADYRWQARALAAWTRSEPLPPMEDTGAIAKNCIQGASTALGAEAENASLKMRLADVTKDREALRRNAEAEQVFLHQNNEKMVEALGEAAKKPAPSAVATSTSTGTAKSEPMQAAPVAQVAAPQPLVFGFNNTPASPVVVMSNNGATTSPTPLQAVAPQSLQATPGAATKALAPSAPSAMAPAATPAAPPPGTPVKASAPRPGLVPHKAAARTPSKTVAAAPNCPTAPSKVDSLLPALDKPAPVEAAKATANNAPTSPAAP